MNIKEKAILSYIDKPDAFMANKATGLKEIAYEVGLSINTVSRALRDCDDIAESTKKMIREKAYELGYMPNTVSQFLKREGRQLVAIVAGNFQNYFFVTLSNKLVNTLFLAGYDYTIINMNNFSSCDLIKQCISQRVDAIISLIQLDDDALEIAKLHNIPIICLGNNSESLDFDFIEPSNSSGVNIAANYLLNYHGISKLIYVYDHDNETCIKRGKLFEEAVKEINAQAEVKAIKLEEAIETLPNLVRKGYTGVFCFNDEIAYILLDGINKKIPNFRRIYPRFHLIGYDAVCTHLIGMVDITSIDYDYDLLAEKSVELLKDRLLNPKKERAAIKIPCHLHQRKIN